MSTLSTSLETVFAWILQVSWQAALLIVVIFIAQRLFRLHSLPGWRQALWMVLLVRLLLPWTPSSNLSLYNAPRHAAALTQTFRADEVAEDAPLELASTGLSIPVASAKKDQAVQPLEGRGIIRAGALIWLAGALTIVSIMLIQNRWLNGAVAKRRLVTEPAVLDALEDSKAIMGVNTWIAPIVTPRVQGPALLGVVRPRLLLPVTWCETTTPLQRRHIFLHEMAHVRRHDVFFGWVWSLLLALHWFNPLMWWARNQVRRDQELACDARVLAVLSPEERPSYGHTLLDQFQHFRQLRWAYGAAGMVERAVNMKRRIAMVVEYNESSRWGKALAVAALVVVGYMGLTDAQSAGGVIVPGRGLEAVGVGDSEGVVREKLGPSEDTSNKRRLVYQNQLGIDFWLSSDTGIVQEMRFNRGFTGKTVDGIGIGDPLNNALKASGGALEVVEAGYNDMHPVRKGSNRVLYEMQGNKKPRAHMFIDENRGILYWAGADRNITQIVTFAARPTQAAASDTNEKFPVTVLVFAAKQGVEASDNKSLLDLLHENFPKDTPCRTHHYRKATVNGRLIGFICADPPEKLSAAVANSANLELLSSQTIENASEFVTYQEMRPEERARQFALSVSAK